MDLPLKIPDPAALVALNFRPYANMGQDMYFVNFEVTAVDFTVPTEVGDPP